MQTGYDFSGWANKNDVTCDDGLIIRKNAFATQDGKKVPLCYNHDHKNIENVIGHAILENRDEGMYAYCYLNNSSKANHAREALRNKDVDSLSIWANNLNRKGKDILHGVIREVSLVLAGSDPGAMIESVVAHGFSITDDDDEGYIYTGEPLYFEHATKEEKDDSVDENGEGAKMAEPKKEDNSKSGGKTIGEIFDTLSEEQKQAVAAVIGKAVEDAKNEGKSNKKEDDEEEEGESVKHNVFDNGTRDNIEYLSHDAMEQIFKDAKRLGSLKDAVEENIGEGGVLAHSIDTSGMVGPSSSTASQTYGFRDPDMVFPDYRSLNNPPEWISRNMDWVSVLMGSVSRTPFSRIKSVFADITEDDARARGYIKGKQKKEEIFTLLKRTTDPQTVYKKQKLDKDDIKDIVDFDVVAWIKAEMRVMLDEEIARAILIGDGRSSASDDKIQEAHVRPIASDVPLFTIKQAVATGTDNAATAKNFIREAVRARKDYKGSGNPILFTTEDWLTEMLLLEDTQGYRLYKTEQELATSMRVSRIVTVEVLEGAKIAVPSGSGSSTTETELYGVIVNPKDYNVGADKGATPELFDQFDIDYNQYKYLIETRISGALVRPYSAISLYKAVTSSGSGT